MIIIDFPQLAYATILQHMAYMRVPTIEEKVAKTLVLDTIRANVRKFKRTYGPTVVISIDDKEYWRRERFPQYKKARKDARDESPFDWDNIHESLNIIKTDIKLNLPYKVLMVPRAESDDIIAVLTQRFKNFEKVLIISGDKDFKQLHGHPNVFQYAPVQKQFITVTDPAKELKELIIRGDKGDGVPNILSGDDTFVEKSRQKPIREDKLSQWLNQKPEEFCANEMMLRNYKRNEEMINFSFIPNDVSKSIADTYDECESASRGKFFEYLREQKLTQLIEVIDEF